MVGAFPPPVHGLSSVNSAVKKCLVERGRRVRVIDVSASDFGRGIVDRLGRIPRILSGLWVLSTISGLRNSAVYVSVAGGLGQIYDLVFVAIARLRGARIYLHHHSFSYLDRSRWMTYLLLKFAGCSSRHVTLSDRMGELLCRLYGACNIVTVSNSVFLVRPGEQSSFSGNKLRVLGFISNLSVEKGVLLFLDLMAAIETAGLPLRAKLAGPFQDGEVERRVRAKLTTLHSVEYVGAVYDERKSGYFDSIDVLVFPTMYSNEAEPLVIHEAISRGIPVIAYGRGAIPEIIDSDCGLVIDPKVRFLEAALAQIEAWKNDSVAFESASYSARMRFARLYAEGNEQLEGLIRELSVLEFR